MDNNDSVDSFDCYSLPCYRPEIFGDDCLVGVSLSYWNKTLMDSLEEEGCNCSSLSSNNNISNWICQPYVIEHSWWVQCIYFFMFFTIIILAIGGNSIVIWIVLAHKNMRTVTNYFLINLALADATISLFNVCFSFTFNLYYNWFFGAAYCVFNNFMAVVPTSASVFTLMGMSLDRYFAVIYPLKHRLSKRKTIGVIAGIWMAACLCGLPMILYSHTRTFYLIDGQINTVCFSDNYPDGDATKSDSFKFYNYFLLFITYLLPLTVLSIAYTKIGMELWGAKQIGEYMHVDNVKAKRKAVKMLIVVVVIFMTCWLPYHLYFTIFMKMFTEIDISSAIHIYLNMYWLAMASTVCNPLIYCYMNSKFRTGFRYVFRWCRPCVHLNKEEYSNSNLNRTRIDSMGYSVTIRRNTLRPAEENLLLKFDKKNVPMSPPSPQLSNGGDDECSQKLSLLNHKLSANKLNFRSTEARIGLQRDLNKTDISSPQSSPCEDEECSQSLSLLNNKYSLDVPKLNNYHVENEM